MKYCPFDNWSEKKGCYGEDCGIWDYKENQCAIVSIGIGSMENIRKRENENV